MLITQAGIFGAAECMPQPDSSPLCESCREVQAASSVAPISALLLLLFPFSPDLPPSDAQMHRYLRIVCMLGWEISFGL